MIELHSFPTSNGWKASIALEELGLEYELHSVDISRAEQFEPAFLASSTTRPSSTCSVDD